MDTKYKKGEYDKLVVLLDKGVDNINPDKVNINKQDEVHYWLSSALRCGLEYTIKEWVKYVRKEEV